MSPSALSSGQALPSGFHMPPLTAWSAPVSAITWASVFLQPPMYSRIHSISPSGISAVSLLIFVPSLSYSED